MTNNRDTTLSRKSRRRPVGNQVFPETEAQRLDTPTSTRQNQFEKHVGLLRETETSKGEFSTFPRSTW